MFPFFWNLQENIFEVSYLIYSVNSGFNFKIHLSAKTVSHFYIST